MNCQCWWRWARLSLRYRIAFSCECLLYRPAWTTLAIGSLLGLLAGALVTAGLWILFGIGILLTQSPLGPGPFVGSFVTLSLIVTMTIVVRDLHRRIAQEFSALGYDRYPSGQWFLTGMWCNYAGALFCGCVVNVFVSPAGRYPDSFLASTCIGFSNFICISVLFPFLLGLRRLRLQS